MKIRTVRRKKEKLKVHLELPPLQQPQASHQFNRKLLRLTRRMRIN